MGRNARVLLGLGCVVVLTVVAVTVWWTQRRVPVTVDPACPPLITGTSGATQDFADFLVLGGRVYEAVEREPRAAAGSEVGRITCSIADLDNPDGLAVGPLPWPDGTATGLPRGTVLHAAGRGLVAEGTDGPMLYCPTGDGPQPPSC